MAKLARKSIVDAAFELLQEQGLDAITARALAARLGVRPGALYYHLPDMSALRDEMATVLMRNISANAASVTHDALAAPHDWRDFLGVQADQMRAVLTRYRDGAALFAGTHLTDDETIGSLEEPLERLVVAGFTLADALRTLQTLQHFVVGSVIEEQHRASDPAAYAAKARAERIDTARFPLTAQANEVFLAPADESFRWGVQVFLNGVEAKCVPARRVTE